LAIVGLFITTKTFGYRVKLSREQDELFDPERKAGCSTSPECTEKPSSCIIENKSKGKSPKVHHPKEYPGISFIRQKENFQPSNSRAHITIGCAPKVKPFHAGEDLLDIIDLEKRSSSSAALHHDFKIPSGTLRQFGRNGDYAFAVYPDNRILAKSVFMPFA
jgi:hypothetical protein